MKPVLNGEIRLVEKNIKNERESNFYGKVNIVLENYLDVYNLRLLFVYLHLHVVGKVLSSKKENSDIRENLIVKNEVVNKDFFDKKVENVGS